MKNITIIGSGGHSRSSINLLKNRFPNVQMNIIDDSYEKNHNEYIHDIKLTGNLKTIQPNNVVFLSVGDNLVRSQLFNLFYDRVLNENLFILAEKEIKRIKLEGENFSKYMQLLKLYDRADILSDLV